MLCQQILYPSILQQKLGIVVTCLPAPSHMLKKEQSLQQQIFFFFFFLVSALCSILQQVQLLDALTCCRMTSVIVTAHAGAQQSCCTRLCLLTNMHDLLQGEICDIDGTCVDAADDEIFKLTTKGGSLSMEREKVCCHVVRLQKLGNMSNSVL